MLGALAVAAAGFLFAAPAAQAAEGWHTSKVDIGNGVMCDIRINGSLWPVNGTSSNPRFYYCGSDTAANRGHPVYNSLKGVSSLESAVGSDMSSDNVKVYVLKSPLQYATASGNDPEDTWNAQANEPAFSLFNGEEGSTQNAIIVYEQVPDVSAGYPNLEDNDEDLMSHDAKHEAGHHFDKHFTGSQLSATSTYQNLHPDDDTYETNNNPNHASDSVAFAYWWDDTEELFAEQFAIVFGSNERDVDVPTSNYYFCTKQFVFGWARNQAAPSSYSHPHCTP